MKEKKQYRSFLQALVLQQDNELERFEDQKQKIQRMVNLIEPDIQALEYFLKQEGVVIHETDN